MTYRIEMLCYIYDTQYVMFMSHRMKILWQQIDYKDLVSHKKRRRRVAVLMIIKNILFPNTIPCHEIFNYFINYFHRLYCFH